MLNLTFALKDNLCDTTNTYTLHFGDEYEAFNAFEEHALISIDCKCYNSEKTIFSSDNKIRFYCDDNDVIIERTTTRYNNLFNKGFSLEEFVNFVFNASQTADDLITWMYVDDFSICDYKYSIDTDEEFEQAENELYFFYKIAMLIEEYIKEFYKEAIRPLEKFVYDHVYHLIGMDNLQYALHEAMETFEALRFFENMLYSNYEEYNEAFKSQH